MEHFAFFDQFVVVAVVAVVVTVVLSKFRLPMVAGLLLGGALIGPYGLGWVASSQVITTLAEVGVVLLLFTIGLEFSLQRLKHIFRQVALGGVLQVGLTIAVVGGICLALGLSFRVALFMGFVFALSSTAIVMRALAERDELDAPHGRIIVGTLIFQDLCVVPMVLIVPLLAVQESPGDSVLSVLRALGLAAVVVVVTLFAARFVVPRVFKWVDASGSREVFILAVLAVCMGTAWLTSLAGLSLALGAFLGGLLVADTEYGHRAMGDVLPLKDTLLSLFFVSLGMLFDGSVVLAEPGLTCILLLGFLGVKGVLATVAALAMRFPARVAWLAGVGLAQFGEFGFVLVKLGQDAGLMDAGQLQPVLAAGILSMFLTPLLVRVAPHVTAGEQLLAPLEKLIGVRSIEEAADHEHLRGHVILVGYGVGGRLAARTLEASSIPYMVVELNAENVRAGKAANRPVYYGDATSAEALTHARLRDASALVVMINDRRAVQRMLSTAKRLAPNVPVLIRVRFATVRDELLDAGADVAVATELEGSLELIALLLRDLDIPRNIIDARVRELRTSHPPQARSHTVPRRPLPHHPALKELKIESALILSESPAAGQSLHELDLRAQTGALLVAITRDGVLMDHLSPSEALLAGDLVYLVGNSDSVTQGMRVLVGAVPS